jgi:hypothetical protein
MQADGRSWRGVSERVDVSTIECAHGLVGVLLGERLGRRWTVKSYGGSLLSQNALEHHERAVATAVIVPAGALTGQPGEQPGFVLPVDIERDATSRDRVKADGALPPRAVRGELQCCSGDIDVWQRIRSCRPMVRWSAATCHRSGVSRLHVVCKNPGQLPSASLRSLRR